MTKGRAMGVSLGWMGAEPVDDARSEGCGAR